MSNQDREYDLDEESIENIRSVAQSDLPASELAQKVLKVTDEE